MYVSCSGPITAVGKERADLSAVVYLELRGFCTKRFPLPLGAWDGLRYFLWHSLCLPCNYLAYFVVSRLLLQVLQVFKTFYLLVLTTLNPGHTDVATVNSRSNLSVTWN